jgi:hypothetical protein
LNPDLLSFLVLISGPLVVGAVTGAWLATGRLFVARMGGVRLPVWIPWLLAPLGTLICLAIAAAQLADAAASLAASPGNQSSAAAVIALLLSPAWTVSAALAALGVVLHYTLDGLLRALALRPAVYEGLALGLRAAWAVTGLLALGCGLQTTGRLMSPSHAIADVIAAGGTPRLVINVLTTGLSVLGMIAPWLVERTAAPSRRDAAKE